ncbi:MAG: MMPL family transporter [Deltaproteobacteria bacterium]|nr:MMPL family transporter [Deltaproteobacteria bacterium]
MAVGEAGKDGTGNAAPLRRRERVGYWLASFLHRRRWWVLAAALAVTALAALRVPDLLTHIRVNRAALQDPEVPERKRFDEVVGKFGTPFLATVVLEGEDREALRATADAIAAKLRAEPPAEPKPGEDVCADPRFARLQVRGVFHKVDLAQFEEKGIYYLGLDSLRQIGDGLAAADRAGQSALPPLTSLQDALDGIIDGFSKGAMAAGQDPAKDAASVTQLTDALGRLQRWLDQPYPQERLGESAAPQLTEEDRRGVDELGYLSQGEHPIRMLLFVQPISDSEDESVSRCFVTAVRTVAHGEAERVGRETGHPVRALVTGTPAVVADEMSLIGRDALRVTMFAGAAIFLLLLLYYRSFRTPILLLVPLLFSIFWTLGLVSITIGRLTLISAYFGGVLLGLGVDYAVQLYQRYNDERLAGKGEVEAAALMLGQTGGAVLTAAVMATLAFVGVGLTEFLGFAELGQIVAMAIWMIFLGTMVLMPVLLFLFHKPRRYGMQMQKGLQGLSRGRLARTTILSLTVVVIAFGGFALKDARLDWDANNLLQRNAESVLGMKALAHTDYSADTVIVTGSTAAELRERVGRLEALAHGDGKQDDDECAEQRPVLARVEWSGRYERLLPEMSPEKVEAVAALKRHRGFLERIRGEARAAAANPPAVEPGRIVEALETIADEAGNIAFDFKASDPDSPLTAAISGLAEAAERLAGRIRGGDAAAMGAALQGFQGWLLGQLDDGLALVLAGLDLDPLEVRALPADIGARFVSRDGKTFAAYAYPSGNIGDRAFLPCLVSDVQRIDPGATGFPMTHLANATEIENSFRSATIYAFLAVLLSLIVYLRNVWHVLVTLVPLLFGGMLVVGVQWLLGWPFNFVNVMALPVLICTGVDYGVYLVHRYREDPTGVEGFASTSAGVMLCALTTMIGFGILMISDHVGMWSLGFSISLGILACYLAAQLAVPALLFARGARTGGTVPPAVPAATTGKGE